MTPARPTSPPSHLWAHQLKREHGHLLNRIENLASINIQQDIRLTKAESSVDPSTKGDIAALAEQVKAVEEGGGKNRLRKLEKDLMSKIDDVQADAEALTLRMASLEKSDALVEEEKRKASNKEKALLKRVGECEQNLKTYQTSLEQVGRNIDSVSITQIKSQLEGLTDQVRREGSEMKFLGDSIVALELANAELQKANERLAGEMAKISARPTQLVSSAALLASDRSSTAAALRKGRPNDPETPQQPTKKKSHKWAGGGADRDIIGQSSALSARPSPRQISQLQRRAAGRTEKVVIKPDPGVPQRKKAVPKKAVAQKVAKTTAPNKVATPKVVARKPVPDTKATKNKDPATQISKYTTAADAGKTIRRAGKGWVEYVEDAISDDDEDEVAPESAHRGPGRPRKELSQNKFDGLDLVPRTQTIARPTRTSGISSTNVLRKRKRDEDDNEDVSVGNIQPSIYLKNKQASPDKAEATQVFHSPEGPSSVTMQRDRTDMADSKHEPTGFVVARSGPPPARKRRIIEQLKDE